MSATLTVDPKKYARLANRIVVKAVETGRNTTTWWPQWNS
jgi:hypothetical protein